MRQFVGKRLRREGVINIRHRAEPSDADMVFRRPVLRAMIGNVEGQIGPSQPQFAAIAVGGVQGECGTNRRKHRALQPGGWLPFFVQRRLHVHGGHGVVVAELDVILPAPDHFHRPADGLRQNRRLSRIVRFRLAPEAAAQQSYVASHVFLGDAEFFARRSPARPADSASGPRP